MSAVAHAPLIPLPSFKLSPSPPTTLLEVGGLMVMDFLKKIKRGKRALARGCFWEGDWQVKKGGNGGKEEAYSPLF